MTADRTVNHSKNHGLLTGASAGAFCVAVIVIGFGISTPQQHSSAFSDEVSASVQAADMPDAVTPSDVAPAASVPHDPRAVMAGQRNGWTDGARECARDEGITDACTKLQEGTSDASTNGGRPDK
jgi:hypothetical protein